VQGSDLVIKNSSNRDLVGQNANFLKNILNEKKSLFTNDLLKCPNCIFLSRTIYNQNKMSIGAVILGFLKQKLINDAAYKDMPYKVDISLVDNFSRVLISNDKSLKNLNINDKSKKNILVTKQLEGYKYSIVLSVENGHVLKSHIKSYFFKHTLVLSIVFIILIILSYIIIKLLASPVKQLLETMKYIREGKLFKRYEAQKLGFEINYLGSFFNEMMDSLIIQQKQIEQEKLDKLKYIEEMKIAQEIQESLLPQKPPRIRDVDIAFGNIFAKEVGGDFYDFIQKDDKVFFVIADIASKGILACLFALTLRSIIRAFASNTTDLEKVIVETNKLFIKDTKLNFMFSTAFFGVYDIKSKNLQYSNCGHLPAILRKKDGTLDYLTTEGKVLGIEDFDKIEVKNIDLEKDDLLFLYTDGITDAINIKNEFFSQKNLEDFIKNIQDISSKEIIDNLFDTLKNYSQDAIIYDDMTAFVWRIT